MPINIAIVKRLMAAIAIALTVLVTALATSAAGLAYALPVALVIVTSVLLFLALLWLWVLWLLHFKRTAQTRELWLCFCLPYAYAVCRSLALLRSPPANAA